MTTAARSSRRRQRGAAMVEAAVVMPVLITCFGAMWYAGGARYQKQAQQQRAREAVLTYATNACQGGVGSAFAAPGNAGLPAIGSHGGADPSGAGNGASGRTASALDGATSGALGDVDTSFGTGAGSPPAVTWSWDRGRGYGARAGESVSITARSFYFCNEKGYAAWDFFGYAVSVVRMFLP